MATASTDNLTAKSVITTGKVRTSFCNLFKPRKDKDTGEPTDTYDVMLLIPKNDPCIPAINKIEALLIKEKFPSAVKWIGKLPSKEDFKKLSDADKNAVKLAKSIRTVIKDGDALADEDDRYEYCRENWVVNARSKKRQVIPHKVTRINEDKTVELEPCKDETEFYSGCRAIAKLSFFAYDKQSNKGISCSLQNIYFAGHDTPLGGGPRSAKEDIKDVDTSLFQDAIDNSHLLNEGGDEESTEDDYE